MPDKITLVNENGENLQTNIVSLFSTNNKYAITTNNELDPNGLVVLHVSEVSGDKLNPINDEAAWDEIKNVMRGVISGSGANITYEPVLSQASISGKYSRDISVEKAALDVLSSDYQSKKPAPVIDAPVMNAGNVAPNPFSGVYPTEGTTPVVQNMADVPVGSQIAPGISEITPPSVPEFQTVSSLENPVDLMVNNQAQDNSNIVPFPGTDGQTIGDSITPFAPQSQDLANMNQNMNTQAADQNMMYANGGMPVAPNMNGGQMDAIDSQIQMMITSGATEEQIRDVVLQKIGAVITNYVDYLGMKTMQEINNKANELKAEEARLEMLRAGVESKLANMNGPQMMAPQAAMYPTQQNMITEVPGAGMSQMQPMMQQPMMQPMGMGPMPQMQPMMQQPMMYQQPENNGFRQVA